MQAAPPKSLHVMNTDGIVVTSSTLGQWGKVWAEHTAD